MPNSFFCVRRHIIWPPYAYMLWLSLSMHACGSGSISIDDAGHTAQEANTTNVTDSNTPIEYVVVIMKENHTFDNYFYKYPGANYATEAKLSTGGTTPLIAAPTGNMNSDIDHSHNAAVKGYAKGAMNGFDTITNKSSVFTYYDETRIPAYWAYAKRYSLYDNFFTTAMAQSIPGHIASIAAWTPAANNPSCSGDACKSLKSACFSPSVAQITTFDALTCEIKQQYPCFDMYTVADVLPLNMTWRAYSTLVGSYVNSPFNFVKSLTDDLLKHSSHVFNSNVLLDDLENQPLANLTYIHLDSGPYSEHPPQDPCPGENYTVDIINRLMNRSEWEHMAILITWDDWGGFYDHVAPVGEKCANGASPSNGPYNPGFRVPLLAISPYVKEGYVNHDLSEQASIPKFIEDVFGLERLHNLDAHARDEQAGSILASFDFNQTVKPGLVLEKNTACIK